MRKLLILLLPLFSLVAVAQNAADTYIADVLSAMKSDAALQMDYSYKVYDDNGKVLVADKGIMRLDGNRYSLLMDNMKVWCDGTTQWSYMSEINEIYITSALSDEAQNLSPLYMMENYKERFTAKMVENTQCVDVVFTALDPESGVDKVELRFGNKDKRLQMMVIYMPGNGRTEVILDGYTAHCKFVASVYECPVGDFKGAEVVDMR